MGLQVEVVNDGGAETIVFISGWPDTPRLWDKAVEEFSNEYRCVSIGLPMYSSREEAKALGVYRKSGYNMDEVVDMIAETIDESCRGHFPITLCIFDWGCVYGFQYIGKHSEKVCRTIAIDVGPVWMKAPRLQDLIGLFLAGVFYQYRVIFYYLVARFVPFLQDWADRSARKYMAYMASESDTDISELTADVGYNYWNMHLDRVATYLGSWIWERSHDTRFSFSSVQRRT
uniref:AB hydrolase-1 domain-containing protein n=1 Tax=Rhodosorus marinus TaxID=101924 RepID=A0A7S2ZTA8_9RHOD|mmetsp:Transcript_31889/g.123764  ORF Transcript_31889/g.123764 Transcript_31889/m.123764 type:complete len:230 (+) Transcript_31889:585-1274(+)